MDDTANRSHTAFSLWKIKITGEKTPQEYLMHPTQRNADTLSCTMYASTMSTNSMNNCLINVKQLTGLNGRQLSQLLHLQRHETPSRKVNHHKKQNLLTYISDHGASAPQTLYIFMLHCADRFSYVGVAR